MFCTLLVYTTAYAYGIGVRLRGAAAQYHGKAGDARRVQGDGPYMGVGHGPHGPGYGYDLLLLEFYRYAFRVLEMRRPLALEFITPTFRVGRDVYAGLMCSLACGFGVFC